ncbi:hypothetical protein GCM10025876_34190 [Demequina litorisediminis]|uniref:Uncharacterized protein n=1 Tax=Demequina litorisediminis TaxID=1849022 RepID=A0ABQ6IIT2_9MICO|nr:hypothetical protein GCM10025876_34190 [Demequina litorisediminis]
MRLGDRGPRVRSDLDQVEFGLLRQTERILDTDDADLFALGADEADFRNTDAIVDAGLVDGGSFLSSTTRPPDKEKAPVQTQTRATTMAAHPVLLAPAVPRPGTQAQCLGPRVGGGLRLRAENRFSAGRLTRIAR